jgi:PAS domain S-box-containing protein
VLLACGIVIALLFIVIINFIAQINISSKEPQVGIVPANIYEKTIIVVGDREFDPFSFYNHNNEPTGFDVELSYAIANVMGVNIDFRLMDWGDCKTAIAKGEAHFITGNPYSQESHENVLQSRAITNDPFVSIGREQFTNVSYLNGKKLATITQAGAIIDFLEPYKLAENTKYYDSYTDAVLSVMLGENDYAVVRYSVGNRILSKIKQSDVKVVGPILVNSLLCIGVSDKYPELVAPLDEAIQQLQKDGIQELLVKKWLGYYAEVVHLSDVVKIYTVEFFVFCNLFIVLIAVLLFSSFRSKMKRKYESDQLTQLIIDAMPLGVNLWNKEFKTYKTNEVSRKLFGLSSQKECLEKFHKLSPEFQPDGHRSAEKSVKMLTKAFQNGFCRFDWMHQTLDRTQIPTEITLVRVNHRKDSLVLGYIRDLREEREMLNRLQEKDRNMERLLQAMDTMLVITEYQSDKIVLMNESMRKLFGYGNWVIGKKCWEVLLNDATERCPFCPKNKPNFNVGQSVTWEFFNPIVKRHYRIISRYIEWTDGSRVLLEQCDDINDLKETTEKMQEINERMQIMTHTSPMGINIFDETLKSIECNSMALRLFEQPDKQTYLDDFYTYSPEYQPNGELSDEAAKKNIKKAFEEGYARFEWEHRTASGGPLPCEVTLVRSVYQGKHVVISHVQDLRELKAALSRLLRAEELNQMMLDAMPLGANLWNREMQNFLSNDTACKLFGLSSKEEYLERFFDLSPEYQPDGSHSTTKAKELVQRAFDGENLHFEWLHQKLNGEPIPCAITLVRAVFRDDYVVLGYTQDLRELKKAISKVQESEEYVKLLFEATPTSCTLWNQDLEVVNLNNATLQLFGLKSREEYNEKFFDISPELQPTGERSTDGAKRYLRKAFAEGYVQTEWMHQTLKGEPLPCEVTLTRVKHGDHDLVAAYTRDIRDYKAYLKAINKARDAAETANKVKGDFIAHMSSLIKTPMNSIIDFSILAREAEPAPKTKKYLSSIEENSRWLLQIIHELSNFSKNEVE